MSHDFVLGFLEGRWGLGVLQKGEITTGDSPMSSYPILFHPRSTKQNSSSIIQNNKPARAEDAGMLGIRSFGSSLSLCMGGKSTQTSEINFLWYHLPVHTFAFRIRCWEKGESSAYLRRQCLLSRNDLDHFHPFSQSVPMYLCEVPRDRP